MVGRVGKAKSVVGRSTDKIGSKGHKCGRAGAYEW